ENDPDFIFPTISRCSQRRILQPLKETIDPLTAIVWFLNGIHPRLRFPRHRSLAFLDPRRRSTYSSQTSCTVCAGIPISLPAPAVECCKVALFGQRWLCVRA